MVELEAEPGPVGDLDATVGVDPRWVDEHLVAGSGGPAAARVVRKLKPVARRDRRGEVQIRNEADPVRPGVRYDAEMRRLRERGHLPELERALGNDHIRLQNVVAAAVDKQLELVDAVVALAARERE